MARKKNDFLRDLSELPWWVGFTFAAIAYVGLKWIIPGFESENPILKGLFQSAPQLAPIASLVCIAGGFMSLFESLKRGSLFKSQSIKLDLDSITWTEFEKLIGEFLKSKGYSIYAPARSGADGGVDIRILKDGKKGIVQCKHWKARKVGVAIVREMYGLMISEKVDHVMVIASGEFTSEAKAFVKGKPIQLLDKLDLEIGIAGKSAKSEVEPVNEPVNDPGTNSYDACPKCGGSLVLRIAKKGSNAGNQFLGCSRFPGCRYIKNI